MSCGIPFFFEPIKLSDQKGENIFVDGGVLSNFPLWVFQRNKARPILGFKLSHPSAEIDPKRISNGLDLFDALFKTMKSAHDERYISRKHEKSIVFIPVENLSATQFDISKEVKQQLIDIGRKRTMQFLETWDRS